MSSVTELIKKNIPAVSSTLINILKENGYSDNAARQNIYRAKKELTIKELPMNFKNNQRFYYFQENFNKPEFWESLLNAFKETKSSYGYAIFSLLNRKFIPQNLFNIFSGSPVELKKHIKSQTILNDLISLKLLKTERILDIENCIVFSDYAQTSNCISEYDYAHARAIYYTEKILIESIKKWFCEIGIVSYDKVKIRNESDIQPEFGKFCWDITAPSYIIPLAKTICRNEKSPGFIVCDVNLANEISEEDIKYFYNKIEIIRNNNKNKPFMAFFIGNYFNEKVFKEGKRNGNILTTPAILLGKDIGKCLQNLIDLLSATSKTIINEPEKLFVVFENINKIEGSALNLRGALFELLVAYCVKEVTGGHIEEIGKVINEEGEEIEIDLLISKAGENKIICYEVKGYLNNEIKKEEVEKWITKKIPLIKKWLNSHDSYRKYLRIEFEYWVTTQFDTEAFKYLNEKKSEIKKYGINWKNGTDVKEYIKNLEKRIKDIFNEHYFKNKNLKQ